MTKPKIKAIGKRTQVHTTLRAEEVALLQLLTTDTVRFGFVRAADVWRAALSQVEEDAESLDRMTCSDTMLRRISEAVRLFRTQLGAPVAHHTCVNIVGPMAKQLELTKEVFPIRGRVGAGQRLTLALWSFALVVGAVDMPPAAPATAQRPTPQPASMAELFD